MAKRSSNSLSKKNLPAGLKRITENGKRVWAFGDLRFSSLRNFYLKIPIENVEEKETDENS